MTQSVTSVNFHAQNARAFQLMHPQTQTNIHRHTCRQTDGLAPSRKLTGWGRGRIWFIAVSHLYDNLLLQLCDSEQVIYLLSTCLTIVALTPGFANIPGFFPTDVSTWFQCSNCVHRYSSNLIRYTSRLPVGF